MASYTTQQTAYVFSMVSNAGSGAKIGFEAAITEKFNNVTQAPYSSFIGTGWSIAWGPEVYVPDVLDRHAANALMVVQGTDAGGNPLYIVATAGTNSKSLFEEFLEDLALTLVDFPQGGQITQGTHKGLGILLGFQSNGRTISDFLGRKAASNATLVFTGHSLGGALTPALALSINTSGWGQVYAMPTAGPTPGDQAFVNAFTTKFPTPANASDPRSTWNCDVVNQLDVVPMAWTSVPGILKLYPQLGLPSTCVTNLVGGAARKVPSPNPFVDIPRVTFASGFVQQTVPACKALQESTVQFFAEALYQHSTAYMKELVPDFAAEFPGMTIQPEDCCKLQSLCAVTALGKVAPDGAKA